MKAIIFNSGIGKRMGGLPKCLLTLSNGEIVLARQLRILEECGIKEVIITTGKYEAAIKAAARHFPKLAFTFVKNPDYDITNYIYSLYLAGKYLDGDILSLHGDLVFDKGLVQEMLTDKETSLCLVHKSAPLPDKDFKGRLENNLLREVSIHIFDNDCYALQPLYKLSAMDMGTWLAQAEAFIKKGIRNVYAEDALNVVLKKLSIKAMSYENHYISEIDTPEDLARVNWKMRQSILFKDN